MSECVHCGALDSDDGIILVGKIAEGGDSVCTICQADHLRESTTLSRREAEVAAHKQITGASHSTIAKRLGIDKSTVDEYSRRINEKARVGAQTADELSRFF